MARIHDVSVPLVPGLPVFPGDPPLVIEAVQRAGEAPYGLARLNLTTHSGTHVDAPLHFVAGGVAVDALPLEILMGKSRVVEMRYFGGLSVEETAEVLKVSEITVARDWKLAKAWLYTTINDNREHAS